MENKPLKDRFVNYVKDLQEEICSNFEKLDGKASFRTDDWERDGGGGGTTRVIEEGNLFEKGGVNISAVHGDLPEPIKKKFEVEDSKFFATGISLVIHPLTPMVPTIHSNFRYFELYEEKVGGKRKDAWFGGGIDLTPYYFWEKDIVNFHRTLKDACDKHGEELYPRFKKWCDEYFYLDHRQEARGVGGVFFDYLRADEKRSLQDWYNFVTEVGDVFLDSYLPIVKKRRDEPYSDKHRYFQEIRRGRYVEFNLVYDRGTRFGLKTKGRTESVLMSLPPRVRWDYNYRFEEGSREAELIDVLNNPRNWISGKEEGGNNK